jgi:23S rRNA pseudouridine2605 synthase
MNINPAIQIVKFDNHIVRPKPLEWIMLYKPPQYLSTVRDPSGKPTFLDLLPEDKRHLFAVGRLDFLSEGLLLLTNDGDAANNLIHPRYEVEKEYLVVTADKISFELLEKMKKGFFNNHDFLSVKSVYCTMKNEEDHQWEYSIVITEGKNRHIRRMLEQINIRIKKLRRIRVGPIRLENVTMGKWRPLTGEEIKKIQKISE